MRPKNSSLEEASLRKQKVDKNTSSGDQAQPPYDERSAYPPPEYTGQQGGQQPPYDPNAPQNPAHNPQDPSAPYNPDMVGPEGERGLGSSLAGSAAGWYLGKKYDHGVIGALAGGFLGNKFLSSDKKHGHHSGGHGHHGGSGGFGGSSWGGGRW